MTRANTRASNKEKLDMVLLCILSQFGLVKFGWELSGLVWFGMDEFGLVQLSSVWYGWVWFGVDEFGLVWMSLVWCSWVQFGMDEFGLVWLSLVWFDEVDFLKWSRSASQLSFTNLFRDNKPWHGELYYGAAIGGARRGGGRCGEELKIVLLSSFQLALIEVAVDYKHS